MPGRRDFLKLLSAAMGSAILTGCGGGGGNNATTSSSSSGGSASSGGGGTTSGGSGSGGSGGTGGSSGSGGSGGIGPNSFNFQPVLSSGSALPGGVNVADNQVKGAPASVSDPRPSGNKTADAATPKTKTPKRVVTQPFTGHMWVTAKNQLVFLSRDTSNLLGLYVADLVISGTSTRLTNIVKIVRDNDVLGGSTVDGFTTCDVNVITGTVVFKVRRADKREVLYAYKNGTTQQILTGRMRLPSVKLQGRTASSLPSHVSCHGSGDDMLMVLTLTGVKVLRKTTHCLVYLPGGDANAARVLLQTEDVLPDTQSSIIRHFSSLQLHDNGNFVVLGVATPAGYKAPNTNTSKTTNRPTFVLSGQITSGATSFRLLSADSSLDVVASRKGDGQYRSGRHVNGPRVGPGVTAILVHDTSANGMQLTINGKVFYTAIPDGSGSDRSPLGFPIIGMRSPCVAQNGSVLLYVRTTQSTELVSITSGVAKTVLASGELLNSKTVAGITFGITARMIAPDGSICFRVRYSDDVSQIVVARPV